MEEEKENIFKSIWKRGNYLNFINKNGQIKVRTKNKINLKSYEIM